MPERLDAAKGNGAKLALEARLVDRIGYRDEVRKRMIELVGEQKDGKTFKQVSVADYLENMGGDRRGEKGSGDAVAVVVAVGEIFDGRQPPGSIGGESTATLVRKARQDEKVKAIVLRVDSPGGSAFGSETIRRELALARSIDKKPVVVSMGSVAASGGYWISTASDEIFASPDSITGSIGIFGMFPTVEKPMAKYLGMRVDGVGTTWLSGALRPDRALNPEVGRMLQLFIDHGYDEFLERVAEARKMSKDDVDRIARGRVWSGADAFERKLVDRMGGLPDAIASAAKRAKLAEGKYRVWYVEKEMTFREKLMSQFLDGRALLARAFGFDVEEPEAAPAPPAVRAVLDRLGETARLLAFNDPNGVYAWCGCEVK
jgi:protease-4